MHVNDAMHEAAAPAFDEQRMRQRLAQTQATPAVVDTICRGLALAYQVDALIRAGKPRPQALLEVSGDGSTAALIHAIDEAMRLRLQYLYRL